MKEIEKQKLIMIIEFVFAGSFFLLSLGHLENKKMIPSIIFLIIAIVFYYFGKDSQKKLGLGKKNKDR